jgi:hypothetical protein
VHALDASIQTGRRRCDRADPNWDCNSGFVFQHGSIALTGKAQNYDAGTAVGDLSIVRP